MLFVVDNNTIDLDWTAGDGDATIILARANGAVDADPELVTAYTANAAFESGDEIGTGNYVVYAGADANVQGYCFITRYCIPFCSLYL